MKQIQEIKNSIKDLNRKRKNTKKDFLNKIKELELNNKSKVTKKLKKECKNKIKDFDKKIFKLNQKLLSFEDKSKVSNLYLHTSINKIDEKELEFWSNVKKDNEVFKITKTILIDIEDKKFFEQLFKSILNKEEFDVFVDDKHFTKSINKLIKNYSVFKEYKII